MAAKTLRKWCPTCKKLVEVNTAEEECSDCKTVIPIPPHEKHGFPAPGPGPVPPPPPGAPVPPPGGGPNHEDIIEILDRIEKKVDRFLER